MTVLDRLTLAAALTSGWPTLTVTAPSESALLAAKAVVVAHLGRCPHAVEWEPWDDEPWELVVDVPSATPEALLATLTALLADGFEARIAPGLTPGARWAAEREGRVEERLGTGGITAVLAIDPATGGDGRLDLRHAAGDDDTVELSRDLALALQARGVTAPFHADHGTDVVQAVVHRPTGRLGVRLAFDPDPDLPRDAVADAVADVVLARAEHPRVRLAPDLRWDVSQGLAVTAWLVAPPVGPLPGDTVSARDADVDAALLTGLGCLTDTVELHVVPAADDDDTLVALTALPVPAGEWIGGGARWIGTPARRALTWSMGVGEAPPRALAEWLQRLRAAPAVAHARVVPGAPRDLADRWPRLDPAWRSHGDLVVQRLRDAVADRDVLPDVISEPTPPWASTLEGPGVRTIVGFTDPDGRTGAQLTLVPEALWPQVLDSVLAAIAAHLPPSVATVGWLGFRAGVAHLQLRDRVAPRPQPHGDTTA